MAKINIPFGNTNYSIEESALATAAMRLKSHLSTVINGSGATIKLGGTSYNIDSAKLSTATNAFVSHLGTIAGNGHKVVVNGVEYSVDSAKLSDAIASLHAALKTLQSGDNGGLDREDYLPYYGEEYVYADYDAQGNIAGEVVGILYEDGSGLMAYRANGISENEIRLPAGSITQNGYEMFVNGALIGEEGLVPYANISKDGTEVTLVGIGAELSGFSGTLTLRQKLVSIFPIAWNTMAVKDNYSFTMMDLPLVKVSSELPTTEDLQKACVKYMGEDGVRRNLAFKNFIDLGAGNDIVRAQYGEGSDQCPIFAVYKEGTYLGVDVLETGLYTLNAGLIFGIDIDMALNI